MTPWNYKDNPVFLECGCYLIPVRVAQDTKGEVVEIKLLDQNNREPTKEQMNYHVDHCPGKRRIAY